MACGVFSVQGSSLCLLHWRRWIFTTEPPWKTPPSQLLDHPTFISFAAIHWPSSQSPGLVPALLCWAPLFDKLLWGMHWVSGIGEGEWGLWSWMRRGWRGNRGSQWGPHRISQEPLKPELCCPSGGPGQLGPYDFWKSLDVSYSGKGVWLLSVVGSL